MSFPNLELIACRYDEATDDIPGHHAVPRDWHEDVFGTMLEDAPYGLWCARLQKKLPGLRGFSERNLKYMRTFYEEWSPLFESGSVNLALPSAETSEITIRYFEMPKLDEGMREAFLGIGFTHHRRSRL